MRVARALSGPRLAGLKTPRYINMDIAPAARNRSRDERFAPNRSLSPSKGERRSGCKARFL